MKLPIPPQNILDKGVLSYLQLLIKTLTPVVSEDRNAPKQSVLLASPNRSVYSITVSDEGVLQTTLIQEGP